MFIGREKELRALENMYQKDTFEFMVTVDGLTGGHDDLAHGEVSGIVVQLDGAFAVSEELVSGFQHVFGHCAALAARQSVGTAAGMITDAQKFCCFHLTVNGSIAGGSGEAVLVVKCGGTAVLDKVSKGCQRRVVDDIGIHQLENTVDLVQPLGNGHVGIINCLQVPNEGLEKVMMGIHQTGVHKMAGSIENLIIRQIQIVADGDNSGAFNEYVSAEIYRIFFVACNNCFCVFD